MTHGILYLRVRTMNLLIWPICILMTVLPLAFGGDYGFCKYETGLKGDRFGTLGK